MVGTRKGALGATKVKTNFADIEAQANIFDEQKGAICVKKLPEKSEVDTITSVRLAYHDLSLQAQEQKEKLKISDPSKAKQIERLGMGFNLGGHVSHSALNDIKTISQEPAPLPKYSPKFHKKDTKDDFLDDYATYMYAMPKQLDADAAAMGFETIEPIDSRHPNVTSIFDSKSHNEDNHDYLQSMNRARTNATNENEEAQKKFGGAKAISSDQFFSDEPTFERAANLVKFHGSNSISSAEYFGDNRSGTSANRGKFTDSMGGY